MHMYDTGFGTFPPAPEYLPQHRIACRSGWAGCRGWHPTANLVRECWRARHDVDAAWPCSWLLQGYDEDGPCTYECGLPTRSTGTDGSYECVAGHDFVPAETRMREGWDYAADEGEAMALARAFVEPRTMAGQVWPR